MGINIDLDKTRQSLDWLKEMLYLDTQAEKAKGRYVKRGQVYKCKLGIGVGSEQIKERPCVILQRNAGNLKSPNTIVAPITHTGSGLDIVVPLETRTDKNGKIILDGNVLLGNIVCVSKARLGNYVEDLNKNEMKKIDEALAISLNLKCHYDKLNTIFNDKLEYIEKLKTSVSVLKSELEHNELEFDKIQNLKKDLGITTIDELICKIQAILPK